MIGLQKSLCRQNLCHVAVKNIKSFCGTKQPTEEQVRKYKREMSK